MIGSVGNKSICVHARRLPPSTKMVQPSTRECPFSADKVSRSLPTLISLYIHVSRPHTFAVPLSFALPSVAPLAWPIQTPFSLHSLLSDSYSHSFRFIGTWKVIFVPLQYIPQLMIDYSRASSSECWHCFVYGLGWPGLFECLHQLGRLERQCGKCGPGLV